MRRWFLLLGLFFLTVDASADQGTIYRLSFPTLHASPGERVSKFELHIRSAMIVGFRRIPVGWQINIDNDPSWSTEVSGIAVVGAANLHPSALGPWFLSLLAEADAPSPSERINAINIDGSITLSHGDNSRVIEIAGRDVALTPSRAR